MKGLTNDLHRMSSIYFNMKIIFFSKIHTRMDEKELRRVFQVDSHHQGNFDTLYITQYNYSFDQFKGFFEKDYYASIL